MVCPFDLGPGHDLHHYGDRAVADGSQKPDWATWLNAGYYRRWVENESANNFQLTTYWSLSDALDSVFETYSELDPLDPEILEAEIDMSEIATGM